MRTWLLKSEPLSWSLDQQRAAGEAGTPWNGVRNHAAKNNMMAMAVGDEAFFYHSGGERAIVGEVVVTRAYYPDDTDPNGTFGMVDVKFRAALPRPVTLDAVKRDPRLTEMVLVRNSRLSVQPVTQAEWEAVLALAHG